MTDRKLLNNLSKLGFQMLEPIEEFDVNETLAQVVKSNDMRLLESFPVLLANAAEDYQFAPENIETHLKTKELKERFRKLMLLSGSIFAYYHLSFPWWNKLKKDFPAKDIDLVLRWKNSLDHIHTFKFDDSEFDPVRLKRLFELYYEKKAEKDNRKTEKYEEFSVEYALSQIFSPKQKELFKKKLDGLPLTKIEKEYYSRTVKKKVVALANSKLHRLAQKLLGL